MKSVLFVIVTYVFVGLFSNLYATQISDDFKVVGHKVLKGETLESILSKYTSDKDEAKENSSSYKATLLANGLRPQAQLQENQRINLYIKKSVFDYEKEDIFSKLKESQYRATFYYMASYGLFEQTSSDVKANFKQNSLLSFGLTGAMYLRDSNLSFNGNFRYLKIDAGSNSLDLSKVEIPAEYNASLLTEYELSKYRFVVFGGFEYETFSTFNTQGLVDTGSVFVDKSKVTYLTLGLSKRFSIKSRDIFIKTSLATTLTSDRDVSYSGAVNKEEFTGYKFMLYSYVPLNYQWYINGLLRVHRMSGPSDMNTVRFGLGVGYIIF